MESQYQVTQNGQEVRDTDLNTLGETSGLADDRTLAKILRLAPYTGTVKKAILPFAHGTSGDKPTVEPTGGANGQVRVNPFTAIIGARTAEATDARKAWRDIRTQDFIAAAGAFAATPSFGAAPGAGTFRWDLVYAAVAVDANGATVSRYVKNPTTKVVAAQNIVTTKVTSVTVGVTTGTADANPVFPSAPADGGGTYYIPLAYVRITDAYSGTTTFTEKDIAIVAPVAPIGRGVGALAASVADQQYAVGGTVMTTANQQAWGGGSYARPPAFVPSEFMGGEMLLVEIDLKSAGPSHANNSVVDSRDWRGRVGYCVVSALSNANDGFPQENPSNGIVGSCDSQTLGANFAICTSQSIVDELSDANKSYFAKFTPTNLSVLAGGSSVILYVDHADSGKLKVAIGGAPAARLLFVIMTMGIHANANT